MSDPRFKTVERVKRLVELAGSQNEHEARNAAVQACKLIRDHKLELFPPNLVQAIDPVQAVGQNTYVGAVNAIDVLRDIITGGRHVVKDAKAAKKDIDDLFKNGKEVKLDPPGTHTPIRMKARHGGQCYDCGEDFDAGTEVWYRRGIGAVHAFRCDPDRLV